jgi:hypothetical protein
MQNRYAGDFGDYAKLGILRALSPGFRLGIAWWLYPDQSHNDDGRHIKYLVNKEKWGAFDPELFEKLKKIVSSRERSVLALENANILSGAIYASEVIPTKGLPAWRLSARREWFLKVKKSLDLADLIFVDPDNGLQPDNFSLGGVKAGKSITFEELNDLAEQGRCLVAYHHQTRRRGGHLQELEYLASTLRSKGFRTVDIIRARNYSPRLFLILNASTAIRDRAASLSSKEKVELSWHPDIELS